MKGTATLLISLLSVIVVLCWGGVVTAAIRPATNPAEFQAALTAAQGDPLDDTIRLAAGFYDLSGRTLTYEVAGGGNLIIEPDPGNSGGVFLDGGSTSRILEITNTTGTIETVSIKGITFQNAIGTALKAAAPGIQIDNCQFLNNLPDFSSGLGGGADLAGAVTLTNTRFDGNSGSPNTCGGVSILGGHVSLDSNRFVANPGGGDYAAGGACIRPTYTSTVVSLTNNVFDSNSCTSFYGCPGGLYIGGTYRPHTVTVTNNTFLNNKALQSGPTATAGAVISLPGGSIDVHNNIFWNNFDSSYPPVFRDLVAYMPVAGTLNVNNNLFSGSGSWVADNSDSAANNIESHNPNLTADYHLPLGASPAKDSGDNNAYGIPAADFEGDPRPYNVTVDIGADEFVQPAPDISVAPLSLAFPYIVVMQVSSPLGVTITNNGMVALQLTDILLDDTTNFGLNPGTCGLSLAPNVSCMASVTFSPKSVGSFNSSLTINSTDPDSPSVIIPVSGTGDVDTDGDGVGNYTDLDDDNDGMPDTFEALYNLNPLDASDADTDVDGDGYSNLKEYTAGTDPRDPDSVPSTRALPWLPILLE